MFTLPEQKLQEILSQGGANGGLHVSALDRGNTNVLDEGTLAVVDNQIDQTTGTAKLKATFPNDELQLWPGKFVNARLILTTRKDATVVPSSVVQRGPQGTYAYVIKTDKTVEMRPIKVAQTEANVALIDSGLEAGEQVVVDGQYKLQPGAIVLATLAGSATGRSRHDGDAGKPFTVMAGECVLRGRPWTGRCGSPSGCSQRIASRTRRPTLAALGRMKPGVTPEQAAANRTNAPNRTGQSGRHADPYASH